MRSFFVVVCCFAIAQSHSQNLTGSLAWLSDGDSLVYYQCHVEQATQQLTTVSGQTITGNPQRYTVTEKFVISRNGSTLSANYFTSSLNLFPNRKFSGLKIREKAYWDFRQVTSFTLSPAQVETLAALEGRGREAIEYDYPVTKYTTNQLIIRQRKRFRQLVIDGNFVLSKLLAQSASAPQ